MLLCCMIVYMRPDSTYLNVVFSFLCGGHLRVGHDPLELSPGYTTVQLSFFFFVGATLFCTPIYLLQVPT